MDSEVISGNQNRSGGAEGGTSYIRASKEMLHGMWLELLPWDTQRISDGGSGGGHM